MNVRDADQGRSPWCLLDLVRLAHPWPRPAGPPRRGGRGHCWTSAGSGVVQVGPAGAFKQKLTVSLCKKTFRWSMTLILISCIGFLIDFRPKTALRASIRKTVCVQLILGQAKPENRRRQANDGERILGHTSSSGTGFTSPAARVSTYRFIKSTHASGVPTVSTHMTSSKATSKRLAAPGAHRPVTV
jgi:hypothetical protein